MKMIEFRVEGRVQGVGFRAYTTRIGHQHDLAGFVRNVADGSVEGRAGGREQDVDAFIEAIYEGPSGSSVDKLIVRPVSTRSLPRPFQVMPTSSEATVVLD